MHAKDFLHYNDHWQWAIASLWSGMEAGMLSPCEGIMGRSPPQSRRCPGSERWSKREAMQQVQIQIVGVVAMVFSVPL